MTDELINGLESIGETLADYGRHDARPAIAAAIEALRSQQCRITELEARMSDLNEPTHQEAIDNLKAVVRTLHECGHPFSIHLLNRVHAVLLSDAERIEELEAENERLKDQHEFSEKYRPEFRDIAGMSSENPHWGDICVVLDAKVRKLKTALHNYGSHMDTCDLDGLDGLGCTCGFGDFEDD